MDEVFDPIFGCFVPVFPFVNLPELTEADLEAIEEAADRFYLNLACG